MKKIFTFFVAVFIITQVCQQQKVTAQAPQKMSYQAIIRNSSNALVKNQLIGIQISILQGTSTGKVVYSETQTTTSNSNGLISIEIGKGANFSNINWANDIYFIKTEIDPTGGTSYTITGTSQLLSVPYALHANTAESVSGSIPEIDPAYTNSEAANINANDIINLSNLSGVNSGDQDLSTLVTQTALGDSIAVVRSEIPDVSGFLTSNTETDPAFSNSSAANITATDIANLSNLSGINTGDQDLSSLASKTALGDSIKLIRSTIPDVSGFLKNYTETDPIFTNSPAASITDDDITKLSNLSGTNTGDQNLSSFATKNMANANITNLADPVNTHDAATKAYVDALKQQIKVLENILITSGTYKLEDIEGNLYKVVKIGTQVWMAENLKSLKFNDGSDIPNVNDASAWTSLITPGSCTYSNTTNTDTINTYGRLYNYYTVNSGKLCPSGWHVPSDAEWTILITFLGGESVAGGKLKELGTTHWISPNTGATNETSFTALPGGSRGVNGACNGIGSNCVWWSSTEFDTNHAWNRAISNGSSDVVKASNLDIGGCSVRCLRDN